MEYLWCYLTSDLLYYFFPLNIMEVKTNTWCTMKYQKKYAEVLESKENEMATLVEEIKKNIK